ncbi:hypothetical protein B382_04015 [Stutzerimonas stutzeri B1SMN1]|nr:hypothetical protein B382_04015 [Stutzerimonas stutzeri B1SMN1]
MAIWCARFCRIIIARVFSLSGSFMDCRPGCGACCIAPSISSPIPGMPYGKRAGERCVQLTADFFCSLFGDPRRPVVCSAFAADPACCGNDREEAIRLLGWLEQATA